MDPLINICLGHLRSGGLRIRTKWYQPKESQGFSQHHQDGSRPFLAVVAFFLLKRICFEQKIKCPNGAGICDALQVAESHQPLSTFPSSKAMENDSWNDDYSLGRWRERREHLQQVQWSPNKLKAYPNCTKLHVWDPNISSVTSTLRLFIQHGKLPNVLASTKQIASCCYQMSQRKHYEPFIQDYWRKCELNPMIWSFLIRVCH